MKTMTIAFTFDHNYRLDRSYFREGITVFFSHLISAMANNIDFMRLEVWVFGFNKDILSEYFLNIIGPNHRKVKIFSDSVFLCSFTYIVDCLRIFKHAFGYYFLGRKNSLPRLRNILHNPNMILRRRNLESMVIKYSKADLVFPVFPNLTLGQIFNCKKIIQIHDLFTIAQRDLFIQTHSNIDEINKNFIDVLTEYSKSNTVFVSSTDYIRDNHVLRYVPDIAIGQTKVISYPLMAREFSSFVVPERDTFVEKYRLPARYITFPSQIRPNKNVITILRALCALKKKGIILNFVTTGILSSVPSVLEFARAENLFDQIFEIGNLPEEDLFALYKYATLVVCPSIIEGQGISRQCLEALNVGGVPVIQARSLGIKESLESVGLTFETADLNWFDVDDCDTLASHIKDVLDNPNTHIEKQKHIVSFYKKITWGDTAKKYLSLIDDDRP